MVREAEMDKRRKLRGRKRSGSKRRWRHKGSDNAYKEFKIATIWKVLTYRLKGEGMR